MTPVPLSGSGAAMVRRSGTTPTVVVTHVVSHRVCGRVFGALRHALDGKVDNLSTRISARFDDPGRSVAVRPVPSEPDDRRERPSSRSVSLGELRQRVRNFATYRLASQTESVLSVLFGDRPSSPG